MSSKDKVQLPWNLYMNGKNNEQVYQVKITYKILQKYHESMALYDSANAKRTT